MHGVTSKQASSGDESHPDKFTEDYEQCRGIHIFVFMMEREMSHRILLMQNINLLAARQGAHPFYAQFASAS